MARHQLFELTRMRVVTFLREPEAVFWVIVFPLLLAIILGWAFQDRGIASETVAVLVDEEGARPAVLELLEAEEHLQTEVIIDRDEAERRLAFGKIAILVIPGNPVTLQYDPQRPEADIAHLRVERALHIAPEERAAIKNVEVKETGSRYIDWLFPGLLGMNLMGTGIWGIGFAIAEIRQKKLLRRFLVTPMRKSSFMMAFILSRGVFLVGEVGVLVVFATLVLGVPLRGSLIGFSLLCVLGTITFAALGVLVASRARTIEGVSGVMNLVMMPMWLFSGVFFSYEKFPEAVHPFIQALPLTALNDALRLLMLEGTTIVDLLPHIGIQLAWTAVTFLIALKVFRWE
ncbi:MAG: ABC transporter permease [Planctomycetota bacterium]